MIDSCLAFKCESEYTRFVSLVIYVCSWDLPCYIRSHVGLNKSLKYHLPDAWSVTVQLNLPLWRTLLRISWIPIHLQTLLRSWCLITISMASLLDTQYFYWFCYFIWQHCLCLYIYEFVLLLDVQSRKSLLYRQRAFSVADDELQASCCFDILFLMSSTVSFWPGSRNLSRLPKLRIITYVAEDKNGV